MNENKNKTFSYYQNIDYEEYDYENHTGKGKQTINDNRKGVIIPIRFTSGPIMPIRFTSGPIMPISFLATDGIESPESINYNQLRELKPNEINKTKKPENLKSEIKKLNIVQSEESDLYSSFNEDGLFLNIDGERKKVSNCNFILIAVINRTDGENEERFFLIRIIAFSPMFSKEVYVNANEFQKKDWITKKTGFQAYQYPGVKIYDYIRIYISKQIENAQHYYEYEFDGWIKCNGKNYYITSDGAIGFPNENIKSVTKNTLYRSSKYTSVNSFIQMLTMIKLTNNSSIIQIMLMYLHISILWSLFNEADATLKSVLFIHGMTGTFKTELCKLIFRIFKSGERKIKSSFKDTVTHIEHELFRQKDKVTYIDDIHPSLSKKKLTNMIDTYETIVRYIGDGVTRQRKTVDLEDQKVFYPRSGVVITSEEQYGLESTIFRCVNVEIVKNEVDKSVLTYFQKNPEHLSTHISYFIEFVSNNYNNIVTKIKYEFRDLVFKYHSYYNHSRLAEITAHFELIIDIVFNYGYCINAISYDEMKEKKHEWLNNIIGLIKKHDEYSIKKTPVNMFLIAINELIYTRKYIVTHLDEGYCNNVKNRLGFETEDCYIFYPETLFDKVEEYYRSKKEKFNVGKSKMYYLLADAGLIKTETEVSGKKTTKKNTIKMSIKGASRRRYLIIYKNEFQRIISELE